MASHTAAPPFRCNNHLLDVLPISVFGLRGTGIQNSVPDREKFGIPVRRLRCATCHRPGISRKLTVSVSIGASKTV